MKSARIRNLIWLVIAFAIPEIIRAETPGGNLRVKEILYVAPVTGVDMHDLPSAQGRIVTHLEMGAALKILEIGSEEVVAGRKGIWVRAAAGTAFFGYVFTADLLKAEVFNHQESGHLIFIENGTVSYRESFIACIPDCHTATDCPSWIREEAYGTWKFGNDTYTIQWKHHERRIENCRESTPVGLGPDDLPTKLILRSEGGKDILLNEQAETLFQRSKPILPEKK